jgi:hypothetical protein
MFPPTLQSEQEVASPYRSKGTSNARENAYKLDICRGQRLPEFG